MQTTHSISNIKIPLYDKRPRSIFLFHVFFFRIFELRKVYLWKHWPISMLFSRRLILFQVIVTSGYLDIHKNNFFDISTYVKY